MLVLEHLKKGGGTGGRGERRWRSGGIERKGERKLSGRRGWRVGEKRDKAGTSREPNFLSLGELLPKPRVKEVPNKASKAFLSAPT